MLTFDKALHQYRLDGRLLPYVSEIMQTTGYDPYFGNNEDAMELGRNVHETTALYDCGDLDESSLHPVLAGYLEGWKRFKTEWVPTLRRTTICDIKTNSVPWTAGIQMAFYEILVREFDFLDWQSKSAQANFVLSIGTTMVHKWENVLIEVPMYSNLGFAGTPDRVYVINPADQIIDRLAVELSPNGKYRPVPCTRRKDRAMAMAALSIFFDAANRCQ